jgi:hypothetical protein
MLRTGWTFQFVIAIVAVWSLAGCDNAQTHPGPAPGPEGRAAVEKTVTFDPLDTGKTPPGFTTALTGGGGPVSWVVQEDASAPSGKGKVLAQTSSDKTDYRLPLCIYDGLVARDVEVSVRFKAVSGKVDEAAGGVVRYKDKDNYYVARANALEDNVRLYKVENGRRAEIAGIRTKVTPGQWHTLKLSARGTHFVVSFDDTWFEADDKTFQAAGKTGLWTKADSVTFFDHLKVENHDER